jgi:hypothetical protein
LLWKRAKGVVEMISPDIVKLKHEVGSDAGCRGIVSNGVCRKCRRDTARVVSYGIDIRIQDLANRRKQLVFKGSESAGESLFGMSAQQFSMLTPAQQADAVENVEGMPYSFGVQLSIKDRGGDVLRPSPRFQLRRASALRA